jgi:hypothetical protein
MNCPACNLPLELDNREWLSCAVCGWDGHPTEALLYAEDEPDHDDDEADP